MVKLLNIDSATQADIQYDGTDPILTLNNTVGPALEANKVVISSAATIASLNMAAGDVVTSSIDLNGAILAADATIVAMDIRGASVASGAIMSFSTDAVISLTTIDSTEGGVAGTYGARVVLPDGTFGTIPIYPDSAITATGI